MQLLLTTSSIQKILGILSEEVQINYFIFKREGKFLFLSNPKI